MTIGFTGYRSKVARRDYSFYVYSSKQSYAEISFTSSYSLGASDFALKSAVKKSNQDSFALRSAVRVGIAVLDLTFKSKILLKGLTDFSFTARRREGIAKIYSLESRIRKSNWVSLRLLSIVTKRKYVDLPFRSKYKKLLEINGSHFSLMSSFRKKDIPELTDFISIESALFHMNTGVQDAGGSGSPLSVTSPLVTASLIDRINGTTEAMIKLDFIPLTQVQDVFHLLSFVKLLKRTTIDPVFVEIGTGTKIFGSVLSIWTSLALGRFVIDTKDNNEEEFDKFGLDLNFSRAQTQFKKNFIRPLRKQPIRIASSYFNRIIFQEIPPDKRYSLSEGDYLRAYALISMPESVRKVRVSESSYPFSLSYFATYFSGSSYILVAPLAGARTARIEESFFEPFLSKNKTAHIGVGFSKLTPTFTETSAKRNVLSRTKSLETRDPFYVDGSTYKLLNIKTQTFSELSVLFSHNERMESNNYIVELTKNGTSGVVESIVKEYKSAFLKTAAKFTIRDYFTSMTIGRPTATTSNVVEPTREDMKILVLGGAMSSQDYLVPFCQASIKTTIIDDYFVDINGLPEEEEIFGYSVDIVKGGILL